MMPMVLGWQHQEPMGPEGLAVLAAEGIGAVPISGDSGGGGSSPLGSGSLSGCGLLGGWTGTFDSPMPSLLIVAAKSLDGPCVPGGPYPWG